MDNTRQSLLIFSRRKIAETLAAAFLLGGAQFSRRCAIALGFSGEAAAAPAGAAFATLTLVNSGGSTQPAGVPTQTFGQPFKDGDIAPGTAPQFLVAGVGQPFSAGLQSYWPSGCLKFATFMLLPTFSLAAGAAQVVKIARGGSWPAASRRTLSEVYAQNLVVTAPAYPSPHNSRSGSYGAWLLGDANNYKQAVWLDGAAGKAWKISTNMAQTRGGAKDGMLVCDHYIMALNNASGGLGGFRWMGAVRQPFYNAEGAPASSFVFFAPPSASDPSSGVNWRVGSGTPTPLPWPFQAHAFTNAANTTVAATTAANGYYSGAGINGNTVPVVLSGSSLPATSTTPPGGSGSIANGGFAFLLTAFRHPNQFQLHWSGICAGFTPYTFTTAGSGTVTPVPGLWSFNRIMFATTNAKYNFFSGTGTGVLAETALRVRINQGHWQSSRLFQPLDLSMRGSEFGGVIPDTTFPFNWNPYCIADLAQYQPGVGDHSDIGALPNAAIVDFYNQSARSEKTTRIIGLSAALQTYDFKDAATDTIVNLSNPSGPSYRGLPSSGAMTLNWGGNTGVGWQAPGFSSPPEAAGAIGFAGSGSEHEPNYSYWAYLRTGELQYLDLMVDVAIGQLLDADRSSRNPTASTSGVYDAYGIQTFWNDAGEFRSMAWAHRDLQVAALIYPWNPTDPAALGFDGTQTGKYLNDLADANANFPLDQFNSGAAVYGAQNAYVQSRGLYTPYYQGKGYWRVSEEWEFADFIMSMCWAVVRGNAKAATFLRKVAATRWNYIGTHYKGNSSNGFWHLYGYIAIQGRTIFPPTGNITTTLIGADDQWCIVTQNYFGPPAYGTPYVTWAPNSPGDPAFKINRAPGNGRGYIPADGDIYTMAPQSTPPGGVDYPAALTYSTPYYVVGLTGIGAGARFDLALAPGGTPITISDSGGSTNGMDFWVVAARPPITNWPFTIYYPLNVRAAACWANALGIRGFSTIVDDVNYRLTNTAGGPYTTYQRLEAGGYQAIDARYCNQPTFA